MKKTIIAALALSMLLSACGTKTEYAGKVGGHDITVNEMQFFLDSVKSEMEGTELSTDEDWKTTEIEGRPAIDLAKDRAVDNAIKNIACIEIAKAMGIELNDADKKQIEETKKQYVERFGGEKEYKAFLKESKMSDEFFDKFVMSMVYRSKLIDEVRKEKPVTEADIMAYFDEHEEDFNAIYRRAKHVLVLTKDMDNGVDLSAEEQEAAKVKADNVYARAKAGEDFDALISEFSEDPGHATNPDGYVFTDGQMVPEFQNGVDELGYNEIGLVKSSYGYHVLQRLPLRHVDFASKIDMMIISERLETKINDWITEYNINIEIFDEIVAGLE